MRKDEKLIPSFKAAYYDNSSQGAAYIFDGTDSWSELKLTASDGAASDRFG